MINRRNLVQSLRLNDHVKIGMEWDIDAIKFITSINLTGSKAAIINELVQDLKQQNIWPLLKSCFPFISCDTDVNVAITGRRNTTADLINPWLPTTRAQSIGTTAVLLPTGYSNTGTGYIRTWFIPSTQLSTFSHHIAFYSRTNNTQAANLAGLTLNFNVVPRLALVTTATQFQSYDHAQSPGLAVTYANTLGLIMASRTSATDIRMYQNGAQLGATYTTAATGNLPSADTAGSGLFIMGVNGGNNGLTGVATNKECAFFSVGDGMDSSQALIYYNIVQKYQNALNRAV